jgi:hypothetical protein
MVLSAIVLLLAAPLYLYAQDVGSYKPYSGSWGNDDGRLNQDFYMEGIGVYCADANHIPWDTYEDGGGFKVVAPHPEYPDGKEILWVPEADIEAGIQQMRETGQYATLGVGEGWFDPQATIYYLTSEEFQLNVMNPTGQAMFEFRWTACREVPKVTNDGCPPGKDPGDGGC